MSTIYILIGIGVVVLIFGGIPMGLYAAAIISLQRKDRCSAQRYQDSGRPLNNVSAGLISSLSGALLYLGWFSWGDRSRYATWVIVSCVICSLIISVVASLFTRWRRTGPMCVALGGTFGFSTVLALQAGFEDDTGLWGVAYIMTVLGSGSVLGLIAHIIGILRRVQEPGAGRSAR